MASRCCLTLIAGLLALIGGRLAGAAPPTEAPTVVEQAARVPAEQAAEEYPVVTVPVSPLMDLPPPSPVSKRLDWHAVERSLRNMRQSRKETGQSFSELRSYYIQLAEPKWSSTASHAQHLEHLARWIKEIPDSSSALVVAANTNIVSAWQARGGGFADQVTASGGMTFATRLMEAQRLLDRALQLEVKDGEAYRALINVALGSGQPKEQAFAWLEAGRKVDPTYFPMYETMAIYLLPRWHGQPGEVEAFASELTKKLPGDDGMEAMARVAMLVHGYGEQTMYGDALFHGKFDRDLLVRAAETLCKRHPEAPRYAHFAALCAMSAQDHQAAMRIRQYLTRYHQDHKIWLWEPSYNHFWSWAGTAESPTSENNWVWSSQSGCAGIAFGLDQRHVWCAQQHGRSAVNYMNVRTGDVEWALPHPGGAVNALAVDPERKWVAFAAHRGKLVGWRLHHLFTASEPIDHPTAEKCDALAINPKLPRIYWTESKMLRSWDVAANKPGPQIELPAAARKIRFSPDGRLMGVDMTRVVVYDAETGDMKYELPHAAMQPRPEVNCRWLLAIDDEGRAIVHASTLGQEPVKAPVLRFAVDGTTWETLIPDTFSSVSFISDDRRLLAVARLPGAGPSPIDVWDLASGKRIKRLDGHWNRILQMSFSADGRRLASVGVQADAIKIWSLDDVVELNVPSTRSATQ